MSESAVFVEAVRALALVSRVLEGASGGTMSLGDYRVLSAIAAGQRRASHLASRLALGKTTVSSAVESLCKRGLVLRSAVEGDNRAVALSLSEDGAELFARVEARMARQLELLCERTPDARQVAESLTWLGDVLETVAADRAAKEAASAHP